MNRPAQGMVLLLLGGAALRAALTDLHLRYVKEVLQPFLIVASVALLIAGAMTLYYEWRQHGDGNGDGHGHGHGEPRIAWLLIAPVLGLLLIAPPALGSYSAATAGTSLTVEQATELPPLPEHIDPVPVTVLDYSARVIWDDGRSLDGRRLELTGFALTDRNGQLHLARLVLSCCAADARPLKIGLVGDIPAGLPDDTWIEVVGDYVPQTGIDPINEATIPYLRVEQWREVEPPRQPYE